MHHSREVIGVPFPRASRLVGRVCVATTPEPGFVGFPSKRETSTVKRAVLTRPLLFVQIFLFLCRIPAVYEIIKAIVIFQDG